MKKYFNFFCKIVTPVLNAIYISISRSRTKWRCCLIWLLYMDQNPVTKLSKIFHKILFFCKIVAPMLNANYLSISRSHAVWRLGLIWLPYMDQNPVTKLSKIFQFYFIFFPLLNCCPHAKCNLPFYLTVSYSVGKWFYLAALCTQVAGRDAFRR